MTKSISKKIHYREAIFFNSNRRMLTDVLDTIFENLELGQSHAVLLKNGVTLEGQFSIRDGKYFLHIVSYISREQAPTVVHQEVAFSESSTTPPANSDFMDGAIWAFFKNNDVVFITHKAHENNLEKFIIELLSINNLGDDEDFFSIEKKANENVLNQLQSGVSEVTFNATSSIATLDYIDQKSPKTAMKKVMNVFAAIKDEDVPVPDMASEDMKVRVTLKVDKKGSELAHSEISQIADSLVSQDMDEFDDNTFEIHTANGVIKPHEIAVSTNVRIRTSNKTLSKVDCFGELRAYYDELVENGTLET